MTYPNGLLLVEASASTGSEHILELLLDELRGPFDLLLDVLDLLRFCLRARVVGVHVLNSETHK